MVFIYSKARLTALWGELIRIINGSNTGILDESQKLRATVDGVLMNIVSWREIVNIIWQALTAENSPMVADVRQLEGLCERMDAEAFLPFTQEDFGVDKAQRILCFYNIVNKVADEIINNLGASTKGLRATPQFGGYSRYLRLGDFGIAIRFSCDHWTSFAETPFGLTVKSIKDKISGYMRRERVIS